MVEQVVPGRLMDFSQEHSINRFAKRASFSKRKGVELRVQIEREDAEFIGKLSAGHITQKRLIIDDRLNLSVLQRFEEFSSRQRLEIDVIGREILCGRAVSEGTDVDFTKVIQSMDNGTLVQPGGG